MKRRKWLFVIGLLVTCASLAALWFTGPQRSYPVGANIRNLGIHKRFGVSYNGDPGCFERLSEFAKRTGTDLAHFNGGIVLSQPGTAADGLIIGILDGKLASSFGTGDTSVDSDIQILRTQRLREMIKVTSNDWRVYNADGRMMEPTGPFSGIVGLDGGGFVVYGHWIELVVREDVIQGARRQWYFGLVD